MAEWMYHVFLASPLVGGERSASATTYCGALRVNSSHSLGIVPVVNMAEDMQTF
jgi:hypothetical protein